MAFTIKNKIKPKGKALTPPLLNWDLLWIFGYTQSAKGNRTKTRPFITEVMWKDQNTSM